MFNGRGNQGLASFKEVQMSFEMLQCPKQVRTLLKMFQQLYCLKSYFGGFLEASYYYPIIYIHQIFIFTFFAT